jgi:hypothetical protein
MNKEVDHGYEIGECIEYIPLVDGTPPSQIEQIAIKACNSVGIVLFIHSGARVGTRSARYPLTVLFDTTEVELNYEEAKKL